MTDIAASMADALGPGTLMHTTGMVLTDVTADKVTGTMPVSGNTQPYGLLHGGASAALAETLASFGAAAHAGEESTAVGVDLNITHHRAVTAGTVHGEATALYLGKSIATYAIAITDDDHELVASARMTCAIRRRSATLPKHD